MTEWIILGGLALVALTRRRTAAPGPLSGQAPGQSPGSPSTTPGTGGPSATTPIGSTAPAMTPDDCIGAVFPSGSPQRIYCETAWSSLRPDWYAPTISTAVEPDRVVIPV